MIKELSSLRGIFILFIFLHHMSVFPGGGEMGVAFFFILGGFAMTLGYHEKMMSPTFNYSKYLSRRVIKFYPLHWLCLLAFLPLAYKSFSWPTFLMNAALVHSWIPDSIFYFSYNDVSWYLADTIFFAVVFPFIFKFIRGLSKRNKIAISVILILAYCIVAVFIPNNYRHAFLYIHPIIRIFDFILGISAGLVFLDVINNNRAGFVLNHKRLANWSVIVAIVLLLIETICIQGRTHSVSAFFWPLIVIIIIQTSINSTLGITSIFQNKWLVKFGEYSFPFFMIHKLVIIYVYKGLRPSLCLVTDNRYILQVLLIIICFIITLIATIMVQIYFINPVIRWLTKRSQLSTTAR